MSNENLKKLLIAMLGTLEKVEVKGYDNIDRLFGVMMLMKKTISEMEETDGKFDIS